MATTIGAAANAPNLASVGSNAMLLNSNLRTLIPGSSREVGGQAIWMLSSCKAGYGVDQLRDDNTETYWQSDGPQPHLVNILFRKKTAVSYLALYTDIKADESYTPNRISVRVGSHANDLTELRQVELKDAIGWTTVPLEILTPWEEGGTGAPNFTRPIRTFMIQLAILQNHQNGRDTHVRQIKIFGPANCRIDSGFGAAINGYGLM